MVMTNCPIRDQLAKLVTLAAQEVAATKAVRASLPAELGTLAVDAAQTAERAAVRAFEDHKLKHGC